MKRAFRISTTLFFFFCTWAVNAYDNSTRIEQLVQGYQSLDKNVKVLKIWDVYFVYSDRYFELDKKIKAKLLSDSRYQEVDPMTERKLNDSDWLLRSIDASIAVHADLVNDIGGIYGEVAIGEKDQSEFGKIICLLRPDVYYTFEVSQGRSHIYPGVTKKFQIVDGKFKEVLQPFYRLSLATIAVVDLDLKVDFQASEIVGTIAKGSTVEVLGVSYTESGDPTEAWYLLSGKSGIIGWHKAFKVKDIVLDQGHGAGIFSLDFLETKYALNAG